VRIVVCLRFIGRTSITLEPLFSSSSSSYGPFCFLSVRCSSIRAFAVGGVSLAPRCLHHVGVTSAQRTLPRVLCRLRFSVLILTEASRRFERPGRRSSPYPTGWLDSNLVCFKVGHGGGVRYRRGQPSQKNRFVPSAEILWSISATQSRPMALRSRDCW
jgi:hypothetical protein